MPRRFFRKMMPDEAKMRKNRMMRVFGSTLLNRRLWHLNRHSAAWGAASGLFWAWIALPIQTLGAVAMAILGRGNVALAMAFTWLSNPFTWALCFWFDYEVGLRITRAQRVGNFKATLGDIMDSGLIGGMKKAGGFLVEFYPMYVGGVVVGGVFAVLGYVGVRLLWRWHVVRRWHRRHDDRRKTDPALRLTSGLAHLHRAARPH